MALALLESPVGWCGVGLMAETLRLPNRASAARPYAKIGLSLNCVSCGQNVAPLPV